jgi:hypothetical protein
METMRTAFTTIAALLALSLAGVAHAITLATPPISAVGRILCSAVNVGDEGNLDITLRLVNVETGEPTTEEDVVCNGVTPGTRCRIAEEDPENPLWCRIEVSRPADSGPVNPPGLRRSVRAAIVAEGNQFITLPAE